MDAGRDLEKIAFAVAGETAGYLRDLYGIEELSSVVGRGASGDTTRKIDSMAEDFAIELLRNTGLSLLIVSEERGIVKLNDDYEYIALMDPLDGSLNYTLGIPAVSVSLVFYHRSQPIITEALAGAVANVFVREIVSFDRDNVYVNHGLVEKYRRREGGIAVVYTRDPGVFGVIHKFMVENMGDVSRLRILGSAALESVYAGLGRIALFFHNTGRLRNLDVAGGIAVGRRLGAEVFALDSTGLNYRADRIEFLRSLVIGGDKASLIKKYIASR